ncbi:hypothetical protein T484DRAFT_1941061, partial [Baffinella frigidus]
MAPLSSALHGRSGQKVLVAVCVSAALLALGLVSLTEDGYSVALEAPGGGIAADAAGIKGLEAQISSAQEHNKALSFGMKKTSASQPPTPCLAGSAGCSPPLNDWSGEYLDHVAANEGVVGGAPGCCDGDADAAPPETAVGDMSIGAVIDQMRRKLSIMKKKFRDVQAKYYKGAPRIIDLKVKPRGPPGYTGMPGVMGEQGVKGEQGALGPIGHKGRTGQQGLQGEQGRQGAKGMVGSIGMVGDVGAQGRIGDQGKRGYQGPPGGRGLPGSPGVMGANGKDGPPGPPGTMGPQGPRGFDGQDGPPGKSGTAGAAGQQVGPPMPTAQKKAGTGTWGPFYTKTSDCNKLGITDNFGGECKPLCEFCDAATGFKLINSEGLRYKDLSFDDKTISAGQTQPMNACILARYGNEAKIARLPEDSSYFKLATKASVVEQKHWYGQCAEGSKKDAKCCTNSEVLADGFNWRHFATGSTCGGDTDKAQPSMELVCIFDKQELDRQSLPPAPPVFPPAKLGKGQKLVSVGSKDKTCIMSKNGVFSFCLRSNGNILLSKNPSETLWKSDTAGKGTAPYKLNMQTDGNLVLYDEEGTALWYTSTAGKDATFVSMSDDGIVSLKLTDDSVAWSEGKAQKEFFKDMKLDYKKAVCVGNACISGQNWRALEGVSGGLIQSGTQEMSKFSGKETKTESVTFAKGFASVTPSDKKCAGSSLMTRLAEMSNAKFTMGELEVPMSTNGCARSKKVSEKKTDVSFGAGFT